MRSASPELLAHFAQGTTTRAQCWKCTRQDGQIFGFTSVDVSLRFDGLIYEAATGFSPSAIEGKLDLSVPNLEVAGLLDSASITEADLLGGKWDNCEVEIFEVNYRDLSMGAMILGTGKTGNVTAGRSTFNTELRGLAQQLQQPVGDVYTSSCQADFGDARCKYDVEALRVAGAVTEPASRAVFLSTITGPDDYYGGGVLTWTGGANAGTRMEVAGFGSTNFTLAAAMPFNIAPGDAFTVVPGCRKDRTRDCLGKWANVINFRGFPDVPLNDAILGQGGNE